MKIFLAILLACCLASGLSAQAAGSNDVAIIWSAPTNDWPSSLWVYKTVPQIFPSAVISNLLAMAAFTMAENLGTNGRWLYDWNDLNFETPDQKRHLWICSTYGYIEYEDLTAESEIEKMSIGVPSEAEAYPLALDYLRKFGIDRSQLATRTSTNDYTGKTDLGIRRYLRRRGWIDQTTHKEVQDVSQQGIYFVRKVDGVDMDGITHGGVTIGFGQHAKISELKITWRGLEPFKLLPTFSPAQIMEEIRLGHVKWRPSNPSPNDLKRITGFDLFYRGQPGDTDIEKQQHYVEPYIVVYASLDGNTNATLYGELPIVQDK